VMLGRIGLKVRLDLLTYPEFLRKTYIPVLDKPPEEQDWDIALTSLTDWYSHAGASFLTWPFLEQSEYRWIEYNRAYEEMWKDMITTVDSEARKEKIRKLEQYVYENAHMVFIYSPLNLYAVNKEVNFVPVKHEHLLLKETSVTESHWSVRPKIEVE